MTELACIKLSGCDTRAVATGWSASTVSTVAGRRLLALFARELVSPWLLHPGREKRSATLLTPSNRGSSSASAVFTRSSAFGLLRCGTRHWPGRPCDRKHCAHMLGPHLAKGHGVPGQRTALIPQDGQRLAQRPAPIHDGNFCARNVDAMMSTPCWASARTSKVCGERLSSRCWVRKPRQAACCVKGSAKPDSRPPLLGEHTDSRYPAAATDKARGAQPRSCRGCQV